MLDFRTRLTIATAAGALVLGPAGLRESFFVPLDLLLPVPADAQVQCTVLTEPQLLVSFSDLSQPASITPQALRNFVCSVFPHVGTGLQIVNNTLELGPIPAATVMANITAGPAIPVGDTMTSILDVTEGSAAGDQLFRTATAWIASPLERTLGYSWNSGVPVTTGTYPLQVTKMGTIEIDSVDAFTGGSGSPTMTLELEANGTTVAGCGSIVVGTADVTTPCFGSFPAGTQIEFIVTNTSGTPDAALVQVNWHPLSP